MKILCAGTRGRVKWAGVLADGVIVPAARVLEWPVFALEWMVSALERIVSAREHLVFATARGASAMDWFVCEMDSCVRAAPALVQT